MLIDNLQFLSSGSGSTMATANPAALKKQMDVLTDKFAGYEQRDSHEFLSDLVDYLHNGLEEGKSRSASKVNIVVLPTDDYLCHNVREFTKCDSCGTSRTKIEVYRHLSVDVGEDSEIETWTLERSLQQFFHPEKRDFKCENLLCSGNTVTQTRQLISCSKAFIFHFKRFIVTQNKRLFVYRKNKVNMFQPIPRETASLT